MAPLLSKSHTTEVLARLSPTAEDTLLTFAYHEKKNTEDDIHDFTLSLAHRP